MERSHDDLPESWGDSPPNLESLTGFSHIDNVSSFGDLGKVSGIHIDKHPEILEYVEKLGKDAVVIVKSYGKVVAIGFGASLLAGVSGYVIYRHRHKRSP